MSASRFGIRVYAVNCRGTFLMTQAAARAMIAAERRAESSIFRLVSAKRGSAGAACYASSRAAVESFTRVAAIELAQYDILVNCISPGLIDTQPKPLPPTMAASLSQRIPALPWLVPANRMRSRRLCSFSHPMPRRISQEKSSISMAASASDRDSPAHPCPMKIRGTTGSPDAAHPPWSLTDGFSPSHPTGNHRGMLRGIASYDR